VIILGENYSIKAQLDASGVRSGINDIKGDLSSLDAHASKVGSAIGSALKVGVLAGVAGISAALIGGTKAFGDYEQSLANVSKTVDGTATQINALGESNRSLANDTGIAVTSLNGVSATLGSLGVAYKDIAATTALVSKGSIAFGMDAETMATQVAKISTVYKIPIEQSAQYLSAMNALGNATAATEPQILDFTQAFGPMATMFKVPIENVAAFGATLISSGVDATEGATSIRSAIEYAMNGPDLKMDETTKSQIEDGMNLIKKQYKDAGKSAAEGAAAAKEYGDAQKAAFNAANPGNTRMTDWAKLLGVDVKTLNQMLNKDFLGTMAKSSAALGKIKNSTDQSKKAFDIWGSYGFKVMGTMSSQADNLDANLKVVYNDATSGSKSMTAEFDRQNNTLTGSWNRVMTGVNDIGITIGKVTSGPVKGLFDAFISGVPKIKEFTSALLSGDWGKVGSMLGDAVSIIKTKLNEAGEYIKSLPWGDWFNSAVSSITGEFSKLPAMVRPALDGLADLLSGVDWAGAAQRAIDLLTAYLKIAVDTGVEIGDWIYSKLSAWVSGGGPRKLGESIADAISTGIKNLQNFDFWAAVKTAFKVASDWVSLGWEIIKGIGSGILGKIKDYLTPAQNQFVDFVKAVGDMFFGLGKTIGTAIDSGLTVVKGSLESLLTQLGRTVPYFAEMMGSVSGGAANGIGSIPVSASDLVSGATYSQKGTSEVIKMEELVSRLKNKNEKDYLSNYVRASTIHTLNYEDVAKSGIVQPGSEGAYSVGTGFWQTGSQKTSSNVPSPAQENAWASGNDTPANQASGTASSLHIDPNFTFKFAQADGHLATTIDSAKSSWDAQTESWKWKTEQDKSTADITSKTQISGSKESSSHIKNATLEFKQGVSGASTGFFDASQKSASALKETTLSFKTASDASLAASNAGAQTTRTAFDYGSNSIRGGGDAVRIGLTSSGQQIAVIGQVAQANFTASGGKWVSDVGSSGTSFLGSATAGGQNVEGSLTRAGQIIENAGGFFSDSVGKATTSLSSLETLFASKGMLISGSSSGTINATASDAPVTGLTTNGYIATYDPRTDTCDGLAFNAPNQSLKTTDPFYLGLTKNSPAQVDTESGNGWGGKVAQGIASSGVTTNQKLTVLSTTKNELEAEKITVAAAKQSAVLTTQSGVKYAALTDSAAIAQAKSQKGAANYSAMKMSGMTDQQIIAQERMLYSQAANEANIEGNWLGCVGGSASDWETSTIASGDNWLNCNDINIANNANSASQINQNDLNANQQNAATQKEAATTTAKSLTDAGTSVSTAINEAVVGLAATVEGMRTLNIQIGNTATTIGVMSSNIMGLANRGGGNVWGGTSISGGGAWIGSGSTAVNGVGYTSWGGTAASNSIASNNSFGSVSWGARGYFANKGAEIIGVGERGHELVLPSDISDEIVAMVNTRKGNGSSQPAIIKLYMNSRQVGEAFVSDIRQSGSLSTR
jgi:hypothetical protein